MSFGSIRKCSCWRQHGFSPGAPASHGPTQPRLRPDCQPPHIRSFRSRTQRGPQKTTGRSRVKQTFPAEKKSSRQESSYATFSALLHRKLWSVKQYEDLAETVLTFAPRDQVTETSRISQRVPSISRIMVQIPCFSHVHHFSKWEAAAEHPPDGRACRCDAHAHRAYHAPHTTQHTHCEFWPML